jgi:two-component system response regulator YesN
MISVVITEDEMLVRLGLRMCIDNSGCGLHVTAAFASGEETEEFFRHSVADVLITDVRLTGMDGLELARRVRPLHPNMAVVVLSCYEDFSYARSAFNNGADRYYLKHEIS